MAMLHAHAQAYVKAACSTKSVSTITCTLPDHSFLIEIARMICE